MFDRDRERERGRGYYPTRSPPPFCGEGVYDPDGDRRYGADRERDAYEQRRWDWYALGDDDKRGMAPPPPSSWRPHERPAFVDSDKERLERGREGYRGVCDRDWERERDRDPGGLVPPPPPTRGHWDDRDRRVGFPSSPPLSRLDTTGVGPGRSLSARSTDPYPLLVGGDDRAYAPPPREFDRGRYGPSALDYHAPSHAHGLPPPFSWVRNRSPSPPCCGSGVADDLRPPVKRVREDSGPFSGVGLGGASYSPPQRGVGIGGGGEYPPGPPPSSAATTATTAVTSIGRTIPTRSTGTRTPPVSTPLPSSGVGGTFYERGDREHIGREKEHERGRENIGKGRGSANMCVENTEWGMGYDRDGPRSPPPASFLHQRATSALPLPGHYLDSGQILNLLHSICDHDKSGCTNCSLIIPIKVDSITMSTGTTVTLGIPGRSPESGHHSTSV